jgi:membrane protein implicated in regulation of membrane protease activity
VVASGQQVAVQQPVRIIGIDGLTLIVEPAPGIVSSDLP